MPICNKQKGTHTRPPEQPELEPFIIGTTDQPENTPDEGYVDLKLNDGQNIHVNLDTGAQVNVLPVQVFNQIKQKNTGPLQATNTRETGYGGHQLSVLGKYSINCQFEDKRQ